MNGFDLVMAFIVVIMYIVVVTMQPTKAGQLTFALIFGGVLACLAIFVFIMTRPL